MGSEMCIRDRRYTDPVGGWIFTPGGGSDSRDPAAAVDRRVRDPEGLLVPPGDTVPPPICRHRFAFDTHHHDAVRDVIGRLTGAGHPDPR